MSFSIYFTHHAQEQMIERNISKQRVIECVNAPDKDNTKNGITIFKKRTNGYVLIVISEVTNNKIRIITTYKSSKIEKYLS